MASQDFTSSALTKLSTIFISACGGNFFMVPSANVSGLMRSIQNAMKLECPGRRAPKKKVALQLATDGEHMLYGKNKLYLCKLHKLI